MLNNKRAGLGDFIALFIGTIIIVIILAAFMLLSGIIKSVGDVKNGEKIYNDGDVGVGDLNFFMENYERLVAANVKVRKGEFVDFALISVGYENNGVAYGYGGGSYGP